MASYTRTAAGNVLPHRLQIELEDNASIAPSCTKVEFKASDLETKMEFDSSLSAGEITTMESILAAHNGQAYDTDGIITPSSMTSDQNNYFPNGLHECHTMRLSSNANREITGLKAGYAGQRITLFNVGTYDIKLKNNNANSLLANRFILQADVTMQSNEAVIIWYDPTDLKWRVINL